MFKQMAIPTDEGARNICVRLGEKFESEDVVHDTEGDDGGQSAVEEMSNFKGKRGVEFHSPNVDRSAPGPRAMDLQGMTCSFDEALYHIEHAGQVSGGIPEAPSPINASQGMPKRPRRRDSASSLSEQCLNPMKGPSQGPRGTTAHPKIGGGAPIQKSASSSKWHVECRNEVTMSDGCGVPTPSDPGAIGRKPDAPRRGSAKAVSVMYI